MLKLPYHRIMGYLTYLLYRCMVRDLANEFEREGLDISVDQYRALVNVIDRPGNTQNWLAETLFQNKSHISRLVDSMEEDNFIQRERTEGTGHQYSLTATPHGEETAEQCFHAAVRYTNRALKDIPPEDVETCRRVMQTILQNLNQGRTF